MSEVTILPSQFPQASSLQVGDTVTMTVTGRVRKVEDELIDITPITGPPEYTNGERSVVISLTSIRLLDVPHERRTAAPINRETP